VTGLFPFQLAASNGNVEASFSLLLANPNLVLVAPKSVIGRERDDLIKAPERHLRSGNKILISYLEDM
jgi:hypothetical protein